MCSGRGFGPIRRHLDTIPGYRMLNTNDLPGVIASARPPLWTENSRNLGVLRRDASSGTPASIFRDLSRVVYSLRDKVLDIDKASG